MTVLALSPHGLVRHVFAFFYVWNFYSGNSPGGEHVSLPSTAGSSTVFSCLQFPPRPAGVSIKILVTPPSLSISFSLSPSLPPSLSVCMFLSHRRTISSVAGHRHPQALLALTTFNFLLLLLLSSVYWRHCCWNIPKRKSKDKLKKSIFIIIKLCKRSWMM